MVNYYTKPTAKTPNWYLMVLCLVIPFLGFSQNAPASPLNSVMLDGACEDLEILNVSWANESECEAADGQLYFTVADQAGFATQTYTLQMDFGTKVKTVTGLTTTDGQLTLSGLYPSRYANFQLVRETDNCTSSTFERAYLVEHACDFSEGRTFCGSGSISHSNCDGETVTIYENNISPSTYIYTDNDYLGCIAHVSSDCDVEMSERVMCLDYNKTAPTPGNGYEYGEVTFTRIVGASNAGYSDVVAERINWIICNGESEGYSQSQVNQAIWYVTDTYDTANQLASDAEGAVNNGNLTGVANEMVFFLPSLSNIQPFVDYVCKSAPAGDCDVVVRAKGNCGGEQIQLQLDGVAVQTWTLTTSLTNYTYSGFSDGDQIQVAFINDGNSGCDKNVFVDYIEVGDNTYQTETSATRTGCGDTQWLNCNGNFDFGNVNCSNTPVPTGPTDYAFTCDDYIEVGVTGEGTDCSATPNAQVNITNPSNVYQVVAEVVYKNQYPGNSVQVFDNDGNTYWIQQVDISGASSNVYVYRGLITDNPSWIGHNSATGSCASNNGLQSLVVYPFRNTTIKRSSSGTFTAISGYCNLKTFTIPIPTDVTSRTITVSLPISEMTTDGRFLTVRATAGGVTATETIYGPEDGCCLAVVDITLNDVLGSTNQVSIEVDTRSSQNPNGSGCGQSWVIAGLVHAEVECPNLGTDYGDAPDSYGDICYTINNSNGNPFSPTRLGDMVDTEDNSQHTDDANGDDDDANGDDEDGVIFVGGTDLQGGTTKQITLSWSSNDMEGHIYGWIDWNGDGDFDNPSERVINNYVVGSNNNRSTGTHTFTINVPNSVSCGTSFARFTIQSSVNEGGPTGNFCGTLDDGQDGEVEDYQVNLLGGISITTGPDVAICAGSNVTIQASASNGTTPYTYAWDNGLGTGASHVVSPTSTTTYGVTVTDAAGCTGVDEIVVTVNPNPDVTISKTDASCGENNGTVTASANNGTAPYAFMWSNGLGTGATKNNLAPGTYGVTVLDANGCFDIGSVTINSSNGVTVNAGADETICAGESVNLVAVANSGTSPYSFSWNNGLGNGATKTVSPTSTTTYVVTVTDANGCTDTDEVIVVVNPNPLVNIACADDPVENRSITNSTATCNSNIYGYYTGNLTLDYNSNRRWNVTSSSFEEFANGTAVASYQIVNLGDANLIFNGKVVLRGRTYTPPVGSPKEGIQCIGDVDNSDWYYYPVTDGILIGAGDLAGAVVKLSRRGESFQVGTGANLNDANAFGASGWTDQEILSQPNTGPGLRAGSGGDFNVRLSGVTLLNTTPECLAICVGESTVLTANIVDGENISYAWSTGATSASITVSPTETTSYGVTVTDGNGCTDEDHVTVTVNEAAWDDVSLNSNVSNCDGDCDGSIFVDANYNTTGEYRIEYTFNGQVVQVPGTYTASAGFTLNGLCAGTYSDITIVGVETGCSAIWPEDITITEPTPPTVDAGDDQEICEGESVALSASASGGATPYTYTWNNGLGNGANKTVSPSVTTTYVVTVTDDNGCTAIDEVVVSVSPNPLVNIACADDPISLRTISNSSQTCGSSVYGFYTSALVNNYTSNRNWTISGSSFEEFANGTAVASMQVVNQGDADLIFNMKVVFRGRTFAAPAGSPKENTQCIGDINNSDWYYYPVMEGFMYGAGDLAGAVVKLTRRGESFQVGTGANLNDAATFGASGWNDLDVLSQPTNGPGLASGSTSGDFNVNLSGTALLNTTPECLTICLGESTTLTANVVEGTGVSYLWSTGETTASITVTPNQTTDYGVTITIGNGCTDSDEVTVTVNPNPAVVVTGTDATCGENNGTATATASEGTAPYTYIWNNDATTATINNLAPGTYSVTIMDANGCTAEGSVTIDNIGGPTVNAGTDQEVCAGTEVTITAVASDGTAPYTYNWNQGLGAGASHTFTPAATTNYRVTVTDANGCTDTDVVRVVVNPNPTVNVAGVDATCDEDNGTATATGNGGMAPYTYAWSNGDNGAMVTGLAPGTYTVTATDSKGCYGEGSVTIENIPGPTADAGDDQEVCAGTEVTITAVANGGTAPFTYAWNQGLGAGASQTFTPTQTRNYTVTITDANGCEATDVVRVVVNPNPTVSVSGVDATCGFDNGTATASASGGTAAYTYAWSNGDSGAMVTGLAPGTYTVTATDSEGCSGVGSVTIDNVGGPTVDAGDDEEICLGESVTLTATTNGGTAPVNVTWMPGNLSGATITVSPGSTTTYTATATDANGCVASDMVEVVVNPNPTVSVAGVDATCDEDNGTATATGNGGMAPYTYAWSNGDNGAMVTGLAPGTYTVTATDSKGCYGEGSVTIENIPGPTADAGDDQEVCAGTEVTITAVANGGTAPFTYAWNQGLGAGASQTFTPTQTRNYTVTITDANGCEATDVVRVVVNPNPTVSVSGVDATCGFDNGTATASASGGTATYTYAWSNGDSGAMVTGLAPGTYTVTATDSEGCFGVGSVTIDNIGGPTVDAGDDEEICLGESVTLTATTNGGTAPVNVTWMPGNLSGTTITVSPGSTTTYTATATDANGCVASDMVEVVVNPNPTVNVDNEEICAGYDATLVAVAGGGTSDYTYEWSTGATTASITVSPGSTTSYEVTVTDSKGCEASTSATVTVNPNPTVSVDNDEICAGYDATLVAVAGGGTSGYTYEWSTGATTASITVSPGSTTSYEVTVTDSKGCEASTSATVTVNPNPTVDVVGVDATCGFNNGTATASASGGVAAYTYAWSNGDSGAMITGLAPGTYTVTATDSKGCFGVDNVTIDNIGGPTVNAGDDEEICLGLSVTLTAEVTNGTQPFDIVWMPGNLTGASITVSPTETTTYTVTVIDDNDCQASDMVEVVVNPNPSVTAMGTDPDCDQNNGTATATASGGTPPYTYAWSNGATTAMITDLAPGTYTVSVTDNKGCTGPNSTATVTINEVACASLGDFVWEDLDGDGVQDAGEPAVEDVTVNLKDADGNIIDNTTTNGVGFYEFTDLEPGDYSVQFVLPTGYEFTTANAGGNEALDSDANPAMNGMTEVVTLMSGDDYPDLDAGLTTYDLALTKDINDGTPGPYAQSSPVDFNITVTNEGSQDAANVVVTDRVPAGLTITGFDANGTAVIDNNDGTYTIPALAIDQSVTFIVKTTIDNDFQGTTLVNIAEITVDDGDDTDSTPDNEEPEEDDEDDEEVPVSQTANVDIEKATNGQDADDAPGVIILVPNTPPTVTWTYVVTNTGTLDLINVDVNDDQEGFVGTIPFLAAGDSETFTLTGTAMRGLYTNMADVEGTPVDENGNPNGNPNVTDEDPSNYTGVFINIDKEADRDEICAGEEVNFSLTMRILGGVEGIQLRAINVQDSNLPDDLMASATDPYFDQSSDTNGNYYVDFIDNNNDGISDEEFVWNYALSYLETTTNEASDMAEVWYVDPATGDEFFVGNAMNMDAVTVTVNQLLCAGLGDFVWEDLDADGIQDAGEPGVEDVTVMLLDADGNMLDQTTTDGTGFYEFLELIPGDYIVKFTTPAGFEASPANEGGDDAEDSDANETTGQTGTINLVAGEYDDTNDAGIYQPASLGDFVWLDADADGIQDDGEEGIEDVTVMLLDADGNMLDQTTTNGVGFYEFTGLTPGDYIVKFTAPTGLNASPSNQGGDDAEDSDANESTGETGVINLESGENDPTNDAGFYGDASLGDFVWEDLDADGIQDDGEPGIEDVTVMLLDADGNMLDQTTTNGVGFYEFTGLTPGDYIVKFTAPTDFEASPANEGGDDAEDSDADETTGQTGVITLTTGENDDTNDAGFYEPASLGDFVWEDLDADGIQDDGEPGIEDVTVMLLDADGNMLDQTTTNGVGFYEFTGLTPGDYIVKFTAPTDFEATPANEGGDDAEDSDADETTGQTGVVNLESGENDDTNDAGFYEPASLGDFVWEDIDGDGEQDAGEPGVEGVTVNLKDADGNIIDDTTTDDTGAYEFTGLTPGEYSVQFVLPTGYEYTDLNATGNEATDSDADPAMDGMTESVVLESGDNNEDLDAGLYEPASLGDFVWLDADADGIQDAGEEGIEDVTVMLLDADGNMLDQTTTNGVGFYEFTGLAPGDYIVKFTAPTGLNASPSNEGGDDAEDSDADETTGETGVINLESGENDPTNDAGFYGDASLGNFVWEDLDADGIQDAGEPGIENVTVMLLDADGNMLDQTTTNGVGFYEFTGLTPSDYIVKFTAPTDFEVSPANEGGDDAEDSDANETTGQTGVITLTTGENDDTNDAGYYQLASLGDFVFEDLDGDGIQDAGEPGVEGVTVNLKDEDGNIIDDTTTDDTGFYEFTGLAPGEYSVQFVLPTGYEFADLNEGANEALDSDADPAMDGMTETVTLESGDDYEDLDAGLTTYDLALTKDINDGTPGPYAQNSPVDFDITVTNEGSQLATNVIVTDRVPAGLTITGFDANGTAVVDNGDGTYTIPSLDVDESVTFVVETTIDATFQGTSLINVAEITTDDGDDTDSTPDNEDPEEDDQDDEEIEVEQLYDLALTKDLLSAGPFEQGDDVTFTITVTNEGSLDAANVEVTDRPDTGFTFAGANVPAGVTDNNDGTFVIASLPQDGSVSFEVTYTISPTFQGTSLTNEAEITEDDGDDEDSTPDNEVPEEDDQDDEEIEIEQLYDLALTKDLLSAGPFEQGDNVTFTITVTNEGSLDAANVEVTDRPETGFTFDSASVPAGVTDNNDGTFVIASLPQDGMVSFEVTYTIADDFQGFTLTNEAEITEDDGDDEDSTPDNEVPEEDDQDDEEVPVSQTASVDIEKATNGQDADNAPGVFIIVPNVAPTVTWTYVVTNTGTLDLTNVVVTDDQEGQVGIIPFLAAGDSETLTLTGTAMRGMYTNNSTVTAQPVDVNGTPTGDPVDDMDPSNYTGVFINIDKEGDREEICAGEEVNFSLTMRILGGTEGIQLRNMSVEDSNLPDNLLPYDQYFDVNSDPEGNSYVDFIDNNNDGISDQEFVWNYALTYLETTTNFAEDMAEIWYVDPVTGDEFFIGNASNNDQWTVTVNQNLCASLGDFVWEDYDADGIQDDGEPGVEGVTVNLKDEDGNIIDSQETGSNGEYLFTELTPGTYSVAFELPTGFTFTDLNEGGDETEDSDADPAMSGMTETVTLDNGDNYEDLDAGIVRDPELDMVKDLVTVESLGDDQFVVTYQVTVTNDGGATTYDLEDVPGFDDDITITSASYTSDAVGNAGGVLAGSGPWDLADDQFITTFGTDVYTITVNVTRDLSDDSTDGGDNEYTPCAVVGDGPGSAPGQGLYNLARLDTNNDGNPEIEDDACGDLPNVGMTKDFVSATPNGDGTYTVLYNVFVTNTGGADGEYDLQDTPSFDDDITINSGSFSGQNSGGLSAGVNTLANDEAIIAGATHTYNLSFNVTLDLSGDANDNDGGDNQYVACSTPGNGPGSNPGEGLYNLAQLDVDNDGDFDVEDDACGDLPNITMVKDFLSATPNGDGTFNAVYQITVMNNGGADGAYSLQDTPSFDDDVTILGGGYTFLDVLNNIGNGPTFQGDPGTLTLANGLAIEAGNTHIYTVNFTVSLDLSGDANDNDGGDNQYDACSTPGNGPGSNPGEGLYNLAELDSDNDGDFDIEDDACGDLPNVGMTKDFVSATPNGDGTYTVLYNVFVTNTGGADGEYDLQDTPSFDDDITINGGSFSGQNSGGLSDGVNTLATDEAIAAGATHTYNLSFNVTLDLSGDANDNDGGDNQYDACSTPGNGPGSNPGEGLYNLAELDSDNDGDFDIEDDACGDLPNLGMTKDFVSATRNLDGTYTVRYNVLVTNTGGATGEYDLQDTPSFDDDVTINSGSFSGQNSGGLIDGVNTLATDEAIAAGAVHVYTLIFNVTLDLSGDANDNDGGDNQYVACGESSDNGDITPGEGLYNLAELDSDNDGDFDIEDDACGDLPNITLDKGLIGVTDNGDGTFGVSYQILVTNNGGAAGTYGLVDVPAFDDDVIILGGGFLIEQGGTPLSGAFTGDPTPLTLATNQSIDAGATHTYTIDFVAELDLSEDSTDGGDNEYTACADPSGGDGSNPGEGLYNRAELDLNNDGTPDLVDDVCGDVPTADLSLVKVVDNDTPDVGDVVTFTITVTNEGPQNATNVEVEDVVPNGYNNIGNISNGGSAVDNVITWTGINLAVGQQQSVTFTATVQAPGADVDYVNVAEITDADQYDNDSTPDNGADTNGTGGIGSEDPDGTQDPNDEDDGDDAGVMPPCMLTVEFAPTDCQDNGTSTNPNDDFFEVIAQVTGMNASGSWTATDSRGNNYSGAYGVDFVFGPYSISGSEGDEIIITITDSEDGACSTFISATTPEETCSTDCVITVTEPQTVECIGGETNTPDDDAFIFTVNVNGVNVGDQGWRAEDQYGNVYFGEYGFSPNTFVDFGPYSYTTYGGTSIILTVTDVENPDCGQGTLVLNVPNESCSQDCSINLDVEYIVCDDNGTEWDPSDDVFYAWVNITGDNASFQGWITDDEGRPEGDNTGYYGLHEFGPYPISAGNHSLTIMDRVTEDCEATITLEAPGTCSDGCRLDVTQQAPVCDNLGTADPSDDVYYVTVSVQPLGNFSNTGWRISLGNGVFLPGGPYGAQVVLGPYLISDGPRTINIVDNAYISCRTTIEVIPPDECSDPDPCSMVAGEFLQGPCNDNGTGDTPADDFYELDYSAPVVTNPAGTQYQLLLDGAVVATNDYGMGGSINVPADGEIHILTWQDATNANCATSATLPAVEPCSVPECSMLVGTFTQGECNDNNTDETGADDFYALTYGAPNVSNPVGTQYQLLLDGAVVATNDYGTGGTINVPADGLTHTLTWQDATDPTCAAGTTLPAVGPCSELPCDISANVTFVYNDNGTPLDHTDDTFDLVITATNSGANSGFWTITNMMGMNETYPYNETVTITGIDANSDFAATIADSEDETCSILIRNSGQAVVGNFVWIDEDCDGIQDDGELGLAGVIVTITGTDMNGNPVTATTVTDENGAYLFTNLPSGFDYKVTFSEPDGYDYAPANEGGNDELDSDAGTNGMTTTFMLMSSSVDLTIDAGYCAEPEPCNIQPGNLTFGDCEANEDLFQYSVTFTSPVITNGCGEYQVLLDGVVFYTGTTGDAGGTIMVPADNANHTISFRDACNEDCARSVVLAPVAPCEVDCVIEPGTITQIGDCNDNGTADDSTDDFYTLTFTAPTSQDGTTNYEVLLDGVVVYTGTFGDAGSTINVPADGATHQLLFRDAGLIDCATGIILDPVAPCSTPVCEINAELLSGPTCTDNGDEFTVSFQLTGTNNGVGWFATDSEGGVFNGFYNNEVTRTYTADAGTVITINFVDLENSDCVTTLTFTAPDCGDEPCAIACVSEPSVCNDNGTPLDGTDDTFTAVIIAAGQGTGTCFTYVIGGETFTGTYGEPFVVGPFPISEGNVVFEVTDCDNNDCSHLMLVLAPEPCSDGNLTVECPTSNHFCPILGEDIMLYRTDPFECTSTVVVTPPEVSGACGDGDITFSVELVNQFGIVLQTIAAGEPLVFENVSLGDYFLRYNVMDDCGVTGTRDCTIRVADIDEPIAICNGALNVQLGGWGLARLYTQSVDAGSYDNCAIASIELRRAIDRDLETCEDLDETEYSAWGPYVEFTCCDASTYVTVEMRVTDVNGNYNICWLDVLVEDKTLPYCTGLANVLAECDDLPDNFDPTNTAQLSTLFGEPEVIDNCSAEANEQAPVVDLDANGNGTITRRFVAIDAAGNESSTTFEQVITIIGCDNFNPNGGGDGSTSQSQFDDAVNGGLAQLLQNYPNPANTTTVIPFYLPSEGNATIEVFDARGSRVFNVQDNFMEGRNEVRVDVSRLSDGLYFYKMTYGDRQLTSKMMVTKN